MITTMLIDLITFLGALFVMGAAWMLHTSPPLVYAPEAPAIAWAFTLGAMAAFLVVVKFAVLFFGPMA